MNPHSYDVQLGEGILVEVCASFIRPDSYYLVPNADESFYSRKGRERYPYSETVVIGATRWAKVNITHGYELEPGAFILACTEETFHFPQDIGGIFCLKSSRAREGYNHSLAGLCDAGWNNSVLTLELKNNSEIVSLPLYKGLSIGQMVFEKLDALPEIGYDKKGHYNRDRTVSGSKTSPVKG